MQTARSARPARLFAPAQRPLPILTALDRVKPFYRIQMNEGYHTHSPGNTSDEPPRDVDRSRRVRERSTLLRAAAFAAIALAIASCRSREVAPSLAAVPDN